MAGIFFTFFTQPLYNALVFLMSIVPGGDAGLAIVCLTLIVKLILFPLSRKAIRTQLMMRSIDGELKEVKEKFKNDKQKQALETMALYKKRGVNPFSSFFLLLIQIPIIFALYRIFLQNHLPEINTDLLYSFVNVPDHLSILFLGLIDISEKSLFLALAAGITQYIQGKLSIPPTKKDKTKERSFSDDLAHSMNLQMRYIFPVVAFFISWQISGAVALYWTVSNLFSIGQELVVRRQLAEKNTEGNIKK